MTGRIELDMPESLYFAHSALSSTQARQILDSPAKYKYALTHPEATKPEFDMGHVVHALVLGVGASAVVYPETTLGKGGAANTDAARQFAAKARAKGHIPVKQDVANQTRAMAEAVLAHPTAKILLEQDSDPEVSVFATDPDTDVELRARFDRLPSGGITPVAVDLKHARDASPRGFARAVAEHGYHVQRGHYVDTHTYAGGIDLAGFAFIVVENVAPYLVGVYRLNTDWEDLGVQRAREARRIYKECSATDVWPGYGDDMQSLLAPFWLISDAAEAALV
jgi:hypothetical protein